MNEYLFVMKREEQRDNRHTNHQSLNQSHREMLKLSVQLMAKPKIQRLLGYHRKKISPSARS
jgi:hypothetical protein